MLCPFERKEGRKKRGVSDFVPVACTDIIALHGHDNSVRQAIILQFRD